MLEEDKHMEWIDSKSGGVEEKENKSQEDKKDKIGKGQSGNTVRGATIGRGGRLLVRGGYWEVQVILVGLFLVGFHSDDIGQESRSFVL